ncbi:MAG: putative lipid II flippase FtsW [Armatimonadota bacterium]
MEKNQVINKNTTGKMDIWLLMFVLALVTLGLMIVFSASSVSSDASSRFSHDVFYFFKRQLLWIVIGFIGLIIALNLDIMKLRKYSVLIILGSAALLVIVLIPGIGTCVSGARRWIIFGPFSFQPSEFAKIAIVFYLADFITRRQDNFKQLKGIFIPAVILMIICGLIELEPDLGTNLVIAGTFFALIFMAGFPLKYILGLFGIGVLAVGIGILSEGYRIKRMMAFINPWKDPLGTGYHTIQSLIALGSGGIFGVGLGQSRQKFFYLPEQHTDFIFAILGEELGLMGTLLVISLFLFIMYRGFKISLQAKHPFYRLLGAGVTFMITLQAFINMGVVTAILPATGIPLPFISFGGSSMFFNLFCIGILLNISKHSMFADKL